MFLPLAAWTGSLGIRDIFQRTGTAHSSGGRGRTDKRRPKIQTSLIHTSLILVVDWSCWSSRVIKAAYRMHDNDVWNCSEPSCEQHFNTWRSCASYTNCAQGRRLTFRQRLSIRPPVWHPEDNNNFFRMFHNSNGAATETNNKLLCAHALLAKFADLNIANEDGDTPIIAGQCDCLWGEYANSACGGSTQTLLVGGVHKLCLWGEYTNSACFRGKTNCVTVCEGRGNANNYSNLPQLCPRVAVICIW